VLAGGPEKHACCSGGYGGQRLCVRADARYAIVRARMATESEAMHTAQEGGACVGPACGAMQQLWRLHSPALKEQRTAPNVDSVGR
jgi:hypothetical protein